MAYSDALITAGVKSSVGTVGDSYDNAPAETVNGLYKAELIHRHRTWPTVTEVETRLWTGSTGGTRSRLHEALAYRTPAEVEASYTRPKTTAPATA